MVADVTPRRGSKVHVGPRPPSCDPPDPGVVVRRTTSGRWLVLEIEGEMDLQVVPLLSGMDDPPCFLVLDLHGVTFMDCSSLHVLEDARRRAATAGGSVRLAAPSERALRLLKLTGQDRAFPLFSSVREATSWPVVPGVLP
jgi:anti-sigma B factor antagonist